MSMYLGNGDSSDAGLQLAPANDGLPEFGVLQKAFEQTVSDLGPFIDQTQVNYNCRFALWDGQTADGRKHVRGGNGQTDPVPWDGASDLRVFLADDAVNSKVALLCSALRKANIVASPVEGNDLKRARSVAIFMRWLMQTQIPEMDREAEILANYLQEQGIAATGVFWEDKQQKTNLTLSVEGFQQQFPEINVLELLADEAATDEIVGIFEDVYKVSTGKARRMLRQLRTNGSTSVPVVGKPKSRPVIRALSLNQDLFISPFATDIESADSYRVAYYSAEQLRAFANDDGWDKDWVEAAIDKCRGKLITIAQNEFMQPLARSMVYQQQKFTDLIGVVYAYRRLSDEEGVPGLYETIFNPQLPPEASGTDGFAKHGLLNYADGEQPFVIFKREFLSRKMHDTRGVPEPAQPLQDQIKVHRDSRIDAASLAIMPPIMYPIGRPPGRWGAGARIPERRPGEYHFADRPAPDMNTENSETILMDTYRQYFGFQSRETDPVFSQLKNQNEVDKWLGGWSKVLRKVWSRFKQFGSEKTYIRVVGLRQIDPIEFNRGDDDEEFDFILRFSVDSLDQEQMFKNMEQIAKIIATADRDGRVDYGEWLQAMIEMIDPTIAERIIQPKEIGQAKVVQMMQDTLAKVYAGQDQDIPQGTPPELGLSIIQNYVQGDPVVAAKAQNPQDPFGKRLEKLAKQLQFVVTQRQNAVVGRLGA